jgi:serine/threonine protein kinase
MVTDNRDTYQEKLKNNPKFKLEDKFSEKAKTFFLHTCENRPSNRYTVETALSHPWITRKKKSRVPQNPFEENLHFYEMHNKMKNVSVCLIDLSHYSFSLNGQGFKYTKFGG